MTGRQQPARQPASRSLHVPGFQVYAGVHLAATVLDRHFHERPTICSVQQGSFTEYYPGKSVPCGDGTLKVTPAGEPHWNRFDNVVTRGLRIDVDPSRFPDQAPILRLLDERVFLAAGTLAGLTRRIADEVTGDDPLADVAAEGLLLELLAGMARLADMSPGMPSWLRRADEIVHETYLTPLTVAGVAGDVGVHASTLARAWRRTFGCTMAARVRTLRMEHAAHRLQHDDATLATIALETGFYDQSHFTTAFRRHTGMTPAAWRRFHRQRDAARH